MTIIKGERQRLPGFGHMGRQGGEASWGLFRPVYQFVNQECRNPTGTVKSLFPECKDKEVGHELKPVRAQRPEHENRRS